MKAIEIRTGQEITKIIASYHNQDRIASVEVACGIGLLLPKAQRPTQVDVSQCVTAVLLESHRRPPSSVTD